MKILLVDDDTIVLNGLAKMVHWDRFDGEIVGMALNGEQGLQMALEKQPDVIISDVIMPVMDGLEMIRQISRHLQEIQYFLLSGFDEFEYAQKAMEFGVKRYILKPISRTKINQLEEDLAAIYNSRKAKMELYDNLWNVQTEEALVAALKNGNRQSVEHFFHSELFVYRNKKEEMLHLFLWLINVICSFLKELGVEEVTIAQSKQDMLTEIFSSKHHAERIEMIKQRMFAAMEIAEIIQGEQSSPHAVIWQAKEFTDKNFMKPNFNIAYLAEQMHLSAPYLSTLFHNEFGVNLSGYITSLRMDYAKKLLQSSNSISEIAKKIGYSDQHYFAKTFKKQTGYTPTEYRNRLLQAKYKGEPEDER